jgi:hypothetical protein
VSNGSSHRDSIFGGVLLLALGILLLINRFDHTLHLGYLIRHYWPLLIILWGVAKLIDYFLARMGTARGPFLTGSEAAILILVVFILIALGLHDWMRTRFPEIAARFEPFSHRYSQSQALSPMTIPPGAHITVHTARGSVTLHTISSGQLSVSATMSANGPNESGADEEMKKVSVVIEKSGDSYAIHAVNQDNPEGQVSADLDVETPKDVSVTVSSDRGDISISGVSGNVTVTAQAGDLDIHDTNADVSADVESGNARISDVAGNVRLTGHGSEIELDDVKGNASLEGDFFGPVHLRNIAKTTRYVTPRENFTVTQLTGRMELDSDSVQLTDVEGAASLTTHNKDVDAENIAGKLQIVDAHAGVTVRYSNPPTQDFGITNESGDVDVTLPAGSGFEIAATSRDGDVNSDFTGGTLRTTSQSGTGILTGKVGNSGPKIAITTTYGTISLNKS